MEPTLRVAFVCPRMTNAFSRTIWYSLQEAAKGLGVQLTAVLGGPLDHPRIPIPARRTYDLLDAANFDGILLHTAAVSYYGDADATASFLAKIGSLPMVSLGVPLDGISSISLDQAGAVDEMIRHLYDVHGLRRFAFVTGPRQQVEAEIRYQAFVATTGALGLVEPDLAIFPGEYIRRSGSEAVDALAERGVWPWALVCSNDEEAFGAIERAKELGLAIPAQLAITGFDDVDMAPMHEPSLTTIGQPLIRQAARALTLLVGEIRGTVQPPLVEIERARLIFRESCGCRPVAVARATDKNHLASLILASLDNATVAFRAFVEGWIPGFLVAFERLLEAGDPGPLKAEWARYYAKVAVEQDRGVSFRRLFAGLEALYGQRSGYVGAIQETLILAGAAESRKGTRDDQATRWFFFMLHNVETLIGQVNDREGLAALPLSAFAPLGIQGVALVRFSAPPLLIYYRSQWQGEGEPKEDATIAYPDLLPDGMVEAPAPGHRLVVSLTGENVCLGYAIFWTEGQQTFACDFLANQFSGALQRMDLLERIRLQSHSLEASLEETRRMQRQLVETEKVASLGRLVAGVAHEINTPLGTGITGTSFLVERLAEIRTQFESATLARSGLKVFLEQGQEALDGVLRNLMKAGELIQAFKGLGLDHGQGEWRPVQLKTLFSDLGSLYTVELAKRGIELVYEVPDENALVYSQPSALVQVAGELMENAMVHAFPAGFLGQPQVLFQVEVVDTDLHLAVTDNGRGLSSEERRHIFDPLYTTSRSEGHAGLGLHLAFQLITRTLGGQMTVASEQGSGTCFLCIIPLKTK